MRKSSLTGTHSLLFISNPVLFYFTDPTYESCYRNPTNPWLILGGPWRPLRSVVCVRHEVCIDDINVGSVEGKYFVEQVGSICSC